MELTLFQQLGFYSRIHIKSGNLFPFLTGDRLMEVKEVHGSYFLTTMTKAIKGISNRIINDIKPNNDLLSAKDQLVRAYTYCFDKAVELTYNFRIANKRTISFNFNDMYEGKGNNYIPEYLQMKTTPLIPDVVMAFFDVFEFSKGEEFDELDFENKLCGILYDGAMLGFEICLRFDLNDDSELRKFLE